MTHAILSNPMMLIALLFGCSLLPMMVVMGTAFLKISIVLALLRNALGLQQVPPNMAMYGISLILTLFIMAPIGFAIHDNIQTQGLTFEKVCAFETVDSAVFDPYRVFLKKFTDPEQQRFFSQIASEVYPEGERFQVAPDSLLVLVPAFAISQLTEGFKIGFLLYLPFIAIDLIVSIILLAMGMMMVSPMTIAMPFKLLIFVLMGGWQKLFAQLVLSYV